MTHALKTWPQYFKDMQEGSKRFELRKDDRPFKVGDILFLQEYDPGTKYGWYTGNEIKAIITYVLRDVPEFGLQSGYCIIGFRDDND